MLPSADPFFTTQHPPMKKCGMGCHGGVFGHPDTKKPISSDLGLECLHALFDELAHKTRVGDALLFSDLLEQDKLLGGYT